MNNSDRKVLTEVIRQLDFVRKRLYQQGSGMYIIVDDLIALLSEMIAKKADQVSSGEIDDMNSVWFGLGPDRVCAPA